MQMVYISGPMRGHEYYNFPEFDRVTERFRDLGFVVISPADMDRDAGFNPFDLPADHDWNSTDGIDLRKAFCRDCRAICDCTDIVMLDGWEKSKGAKAEHALAVALGLNVLDEFGTPIGLDKANPKDAIGSSKPQLHLIPPVADIAECQALQQGAKNYGPFNWRETPVRATVYISALRRHLAQWFDGQNIDAESGISHLAHARANLSILLDAEACGNLIDDRPPAGGASASIAEAC